MPAYKNKFTTPKYIEETVVDTRGTTVGTIRVKPSGVLWKPSGQQRFYSVPLDVFAAWITSGAAGATRTKS